MLTGGMAVNGGDIGARGTTGPFLGDSAAVDALTGVQVQTTHNIIAASVNLGTGAHVGDVQTSHLVSGTGATHGNVSALVALPALPAAAAVSPGTTNLTVATGATVSTSPGHFATISVGTGSTLKLAAGAYDMTTLTLSTGAKLQALGAVQIHVAGRVSTSSGAIIGPASGVTLTASGIRIEVSGQNGTTGALTATPPAASFGTGNNVTALILVPNGSLVFGTGAVATGAFMGRDVDLGGSGTTITYQDGFPNGGCTAQSCDDGNACTVDTCGTNGVCTHAAAANGTSCSDNNACTTGETCQAGACTGGSAVTCTADQCHTVGACVPAMGCPAPVAKTNGTSCSDNNACTSGETCQAGACTGGSAVTCSGADQCHTVGACVPATGCPAPVAVANGTGCNDSNACTSGETCQAGACTGGSAVTCTADQCHTVGACLPATGCPAPVAKTNGTTCSDSNACTSGETCQSGACTGGSAVTCTADQCHTVGACVPATGCPAPVAKTNGTTCSDNNACTSGESCQSGACTGGTAVTCTADQCHTVGACVPATGCPAPAAKANGTTCDDNNLCTQTDTCQSGTCTGGNPKTCTASDQCHVVGTCVPATGVCSNPNATNGTLCNDGNACTLADSCQVGVCTGSAVTCVAQDQCHAAGTCNSGTGTCTNPTKSDGSACDDGNSCTSGDSCHAGSCTPGTSTCASLTIVELPPFIQTFPQLGATLTTTQTAPLVPGDLASFSSTVTNTGLFSDQLVGINITNNGTTPFTIGAYQQTIDYFSPATQSWVTLAKLAVDSTGTPIADPTVTAITSGGLFGTTIAPGTTFAVTTRVDATFPADETNLLFNPALASQVRDTLQIDTGSGPPAAPGTADISSAFTEGSGTITGATVVVAFSGGGVETDTTISAPNTTLEPGQSVTYTPSIAAPPMSPRDPSETSTAYLNRLAFNLAYSSYAIQARANGHGTPFDPTQTIAYLGIPWQFPIINLTKSGPAQGIAGLTLPYQVQVHNVGTSIAGPFTMIDTVDGNDVGAQVVLPPSVAAGATATATLNAPTPLGRPPGPITDAPVVTWKDRNGNLYGPTSDTSFTTNLLAGNPQGYLTLSGATGAPQFLGSPQTLTATALDGTAKPAAGVAVHLAITGVNAQTADIVTGADGTASFSYDGPNLGQDHATLTGTINGPVVTSNTITVTWVSPAGGSQPCTGGATPLDVVMVIDGSPSMFTDDNVATAQAATNSFIDDLNPTRDQIGFEIFSNDAPLNAPMSSDFASAKTTIDNGLLLAAEACDGFFCFGGTNVSMGLGAGLAELQGPRHRSNATPLMVVLSDGGNNQGDPAPAIAAIKAAGIRVISIAMGAAINVPLMQQIASSPNDYFYAPTTTELAWAYGNVTQDACRSLAPLVSAGGNQGLYSVRLPDTLTLQGEAHGSGPRGDLGLTTTWTEVSGPGPVTFTDASSPVTSALFTVPGTYVLQLEASDGFLTTADRATITVDSAPSLTSASLLVSLSSPGPLTTGTPETLTAVLTDAQAHPITDFTIQVTVSGANPASGTLTTDATGTARFTYTGALAGVDVLQTTALGATAQLPAAPLSVTWVASNNGAVVTQGWIGGPTLQATVMGLVPVTVAAAAGVTVTSGTVSYWPIASPTDVHTIATGIHGGPGATVATFDTTTLPNGTYVIDLTGTDSQGDQQDNEVAVTVAGDYKPGRVVVEQTDFTIPIAGIPITIGRRYDSLLRNQVGDFGNGWSLAVSHPDLQTDPAHNVTMTMPNGRRVTFYFTPTSYPFPFQHLFQPTYTPEAGVFGKLTSDGCPLIVQVDGQLDCFEDSSAAYVPTTYTYTDAYGVVYTMGADGTLKSIQDRNNNILTFATNGIVSTSTGLTVQFTRDDQGRITQITTPQFFVNGIGDRNVYGYNYDVDGNLNTVVAVNFGPTLYTYTYDANHLLLTSTDPDGHPARTSTYDAANRLASDTDALGNITRYAYDVPGHTTTTTYPDTGVMRQTLDDRGLLLSQTDQLGRTTTHVYDANRNETKRTNALGEVTTYTYDALGNQTSSVNARGETTVTTYNSFSQPLTTTNPIGNTTIIAYDDTGLPTSFTDSLGTLATFTSSEHGLPTSVTDTAGNTAYLNYEVVSRLMWNLATAPLPDAALGLCSTTRYAAASSSRAMTSTIFS
jgi:YD repeat-containing protein